METLINDCKEIYKGQDIKKETNLSVERLIDNTLSNNVGINPNIFNGNPCFKNTRLPIEMLFGYLQSDHIVDDFIDSYPIVTSQQIREMLEVAKYLILNKV